MRRISIASWPCAIAAVLSATFAVEGVEVPKRFAGGDQIAVIDVSRVVEAYAPYRHAIQAIEVETAALARKYPPIEPGCGTGQFGGCEPSFVRAVREGAFTPDSLDKMIAMHRKRVVARRRVAEQQKRQIVQRKTELIAEAYNDLQCEIAQYCEEHDFRLVLRVDSIKSAEELRKTKGWVRTWDCRGAWSELVIGKGASFYFIEQIDITDEILKRMNVIHDVHR